MRLFDRSELSSLPGRCLSPVQIGHSVFVLAVIAVSTVVSCAQGAPLPRAEIDKDSCGSFVQEFYDWYTPIAASAGTRMTVSLLPRQMSFDQKLWKMLVVDDEAQSKSSEIVGLEFDPILNTQDPSSKFIVKNASMIGARCNATVVGINQGVEDEQVVPELIRSGGRWVFVNFHYQDEVAGKLWHSNLVQVLRYWQKQRSRLPKGKSE